MDTQALETKAESAAGLMAALANPRRLVILCKLVEGEKSVGALVEGVGIAQSALSQHLAKLREQGLVKTRREAQTIFYSLASAEAEAVLSVLHDIYCASVNSEPAARR